jgi:hypothetical protein
VGQAPGHDQASDARRGQRGCLVSIIAHATPHEQGGDEIHPAPDCVRNGCVSVLAWSLVSLAGHALRQMR